jgi:phage baseplate assembly protein W
MATIQKNSPIFLGIYFPFSKGTNGFPQTVTDEECIQNDLSLLLHTRKGERIMLPDFGLELERLIFENTGPLLRAKAFRQVSDAIGNYEPRVQLLDVQITENVYEVIIDVIYSINSLTGKTTLNFTRGTNG